jgi:hypothetical protein
MARMGLGVGACGRKVAPPGIYHDLTFRWTTNPSPYPLSSCRNRMGEDDFLQRSGESLPLSVNPPQFVGQL